MAAPLTQIEEVPTVEEIAFMLKTTPHNGFPVVDQKGKLKGLISRKILMLILQKKCW
jgi:CBS domain-containing protein